MKRYSEQLVPYLLRLFDGESQVQSAALGVCLNLSHDKDFCDLFIQNNLISKLGAMSSSSFIGTYQLLYQLSIADHRRNSDYFSEIIPKVMKLILEPKSESISLEVMSLAINITLNYKMALSIASGSGIKFIFKK